MTGRTRGRTCDGLWVLIAVCGGSGDYERQRQKISCTPAQGRSEARAPLPPAGASCFLPDDAAASEQKPSRRRRDRSTRGARVE